MDWSYITGPLVGSIIGYVTNYIAVKMLFRPLHPLKIKGHIVPFSQGIIPKSKNRLAKAVGNAVGNNLITSDALEEALLSEPIKEKVRLGIYELIEKNLENEKPIKEVFSTYIGEERFELQTLKVQSYITEKINNKVIESHIGEMISDVVMKALKEKLQNSILSIVSTDSILDPIKGKITKSINSYIEVNGEQMIKNLVENETDELLNNPVSRITENIDKVKENIADTAIDTYESIVKNKLPAMLENININNIVQKKIEDMELLEMERLVLSIMKNELNAVVNLGALIGLIIGLVNLFFK